MASYNYDLIIQGVKISLIHNETDKDHVYNPQKKEKLTIKIGSETFDYESSEFNSKHPEIKLPQFTNLNLAKWFSAHKLLFPTVVSRDEESKFSEIQDFCKSKGVNLQEAISLLPKVTDLRKVKEKVNQDAELTGWYKNLVDDADIQTIDKKLKALAVIAVMLSLKTSDPQSFYHSNIPTDKKANKKYIDAALDKFSKGKIKIGVSDRVTDTGTPAEYIQNLDTVFVSSSFSILSLQDRGIVVHEFFHAYQDLMKGETSRRSMEAEAHQKSSEYFLHELGVSKTTSREQVKTMVKQHLSQFAELFPEYHAFWVAYDRFTNDSKLAEDESTLKRILELNECFAVLDERNLGQFIQSSLGQLVNTANANPLSSKQIQTTAIGSAKSEKKRYLDELKAIMKAHPKLYYTEKDGREAMNKIYFYFSQALLEFTLTQYPNLLTDRNLQQGFRLTPTRSQYYDLLKEVVDLQPFSQIYVKWDGIQ